VTLRCSRDESRIPPLSSSAGLLRGSFKGSMSIRYTFSASDSTAVVVTIGPHACAIPIAHVTETMRQLRVEPMVGAPSFVRGLSVIRGVPVPVVDLAAVLGLPSSGSLSRLVVLGIGSRRVALAVDGVAGVISIDAATIPAIAPLLRSASADAITAIGTLDKQLLFVLEASRILPDQTIEVVPDPGAST